MLGRTNVANNTISEYKHNTSRRPFNILIAREVSSAFCPVLALIQYCELRGPSFRPLFCYAAESPILTHQFSVELQRSKHLKVRGPPAVIILPLVIAYLSTESISRVCGMPVDSVGQWAATQHASSFASTNNIFKIS